MADWLNRLLPDSTRVLVSPALRCQQTAQALGRKFKTREALGPGAAPRRCWTRRAGPTGASRCW